MLPLLQLLLRQPLFHLQVLLPRVGHAALAPRQAPPRPQPQPQLLFLGAGVELLYRPLPVRRVHLWTLPQFTHPLGFLYFVGHLLVGHPSAGLYLLQLLHDFLEVLLLYLLPLLLSPAQVQSDVLVLAAFLSALLLSGLTGRDLEVVLGLFEVGEEKFEFFFLRFGWEELPFLLGVADESLPLAGLVLGVSLREGLLPPELLAVLPDLLRLPEGLLLPLPVLASDFLEFAFPVVVEHLDFLFEGELVLFLVEGVLLHALADVLLPLPRPRLLLLPDLLDVLLDPLPLADLPRQLGHLLFV